MGAEQLSLHGPQWPLRSFSVREFGAFRARRTSEKEGACGKAGYPCTHWGVDLTAPEGTQVFVPFTGWVLYYGPADDAPFVGFGPWVALIAHADRQVSLASRVWEKATGPLLGPRGDLPGTNVPMPGLLDITKLPEGAASVRYSLIGHLAPPQTLEHTGEVTFLPLPGTTTKPHALVKDIWDAAKAKPNSNHWRPEKGDANSVVMMTGADGYSPDRVAYAGQQLGTVSNKNHVHWEMRTAPIAPAAAGAWRIDPLATFNQAYGIPLPEGVAPKVQEEGITPVSRGGGGGLLLLAAAFLFGKKKRGKRR